QRLKRLRSPAPVDVGMPALSHLQEIARVARRDLQTLERVGRLPGDELSNGVVHPEAELTSGKAILVGAQQRFFPQRLNQVENGVTLPPHAHEGLRSLEEKAAAEDGTLSERVALDRREQLPGPLDGAAQRCLAGPGAPRSRFE